MTAKRQQIATALRERGVEVYLSEDIIASVGEPDVNVVLQEDQHWRRFNTIVVLDFSAGPGQELAAYHHNFDFRLKCMVFHPWEWDPVRNPSYGSQILELFPHRIPCIQDEIDNCNLVASCISRVMALRFCSPE